MARKRSSNIVFKYIVYCWKDNFMQIKNKVFKHSQIAYCRKDNFMQIKNENLTKV